MSNLVSARVHKKVFGSATRKSVMIYFADKASDGGEGIWASKSTIAAELELARSTVIKIINELVHDGILIVVGDRRHRNGATVEYDISMATVEDLPDVETPRSEPVPGRGESGLTRPTAGPVRDADPSDSRTPPVRQPDIMVSDSRTQTILKPSKNLMRAREPDSSKLFQQFWDAHPRAGNRDRTLALWLEAENSGTDTQRIISEARRYRQMSKGKDKRYLVASDLWLEQRRWDGTGGQGDDASTNKKRDIEANAEMFARKIREGKYVPPVALTDAITAAMRANRMVTDDQLKHLGVRI